MLDEMGIKKYISWDSKKCHDYVDFDNGVVDDSLPTELVCIVVILYRWPQWQV